MFFSVCIVFCFCLCRGVETIVRGSKVAKPRKNPVTNLHQGKPVKSENCALRIIAGFLEVLI